MCTHVCLSIYPFKNHEFYVPGYPKCQSSTTKFILVFLLSIFAPHFDICERLGFHYHIVPTYLLNQKNKQKQKK